MRAALLSLALLALAGPARADAPTGGEVARRLVDDVLTPIAVGLEEAGYARHVALRSPDLTDADLETAVTGFFLDRGFEVYLLEAEDPVPVGEVAMLDLADVQAALAYPRTDDGFWGLGSRRLLRQASLSLWGRLEDPRTGRQLWQGTPEAKYEDWIRESERDQLSADRPAWLRENQAAGLGNPPAAWKEKAVVAGLLGGVILLYFSGAN